jgi:hypothetical protein
MKKIILNTLALSTILSIALLPTIIFAQSIGIPNPLKLNSISDVVLSVVKIVRVIALPFVVIMILYSGFLFIWARGNAEGITTAKKTLVYVLIGAFIILASEMIGYLLRDTVNGLTGN